VTSRAVSVEPLLPVYINRKYIHVGVHFVGPLTRCASPSLAAGSTREVEVTVFGVRACRADHPRLSQGSTAPLMGKGKGRGLLYYVLSLVSSTHSPFGFAPFGRQKKIEKK